MSYHPLSWIRHDLAFEIDFFLLFLLNPEELGDSRNSDFLCKRSRLHSRLSLGSRPEERALFYLPSHCLSSAGIPAQSEAPSARGRGRGKNVCDSARVE